MLIPTDNSLRPDLPETEFQTNPARTLYLLHGYTGCSDDFLYNSSIFQLAIQHKMAVIMPNGESAFYLEDREKNEDYSKFVGKELVDFTRSMFRLSQKREDTFIGGMSMGGYGALISALRYPRTFSKAVSLSGAYVELEFADQKRYIPDFNSDEAYQKKVFGDVETMRQRNVDPRFCMEEIRRWGEPVPEIYFAYGEQDFMISQNRKLHCYIAISTYVDEMQSVESVCAFWSSTGPSVCLSSSGDYTNGDDFEGQPAETVYSATSMARRYLGLPLHPVGIRCPPSIGCRNSKQCAGRLMTGFGAA